MSATKIVYAPGVQAPQGYVIEELSKLVNVIGPVIVTSGLRLGDSGEHGKGLAVDIVPAPGNNISLLDMYLAAERFNFKGVGVYPNWDNDGKGNKSGGLHLDLRAGPAARWMGLASGKQQQYIALSKENLKKCGVI